MKALDYLKEVLGDSPVFPKTEEEALDLLIKSHRRQRDIIGEEVSKRVKTPEWQAWAEEVSKMSLQECIDWLEKLQKQKK